MPRWRACTRETPLQAAPGAGVIQGLGFHSKRGFGIPLSVYSRCCILVSHYQSFDAVYVHVVPWSEFSIVIYYPHYQQAPISNRSVFESQCPHNAANLIRNPNVKYFEQRSIMKRPFKIGPIWVVIDGEGVCELLDRLEGRVQFSFRIWKKICTITSKTQLVSILR